MVARGPSGLCIRPRAQTRPTPSTPARGCLGSEGPGRCSPTRARNPARGPTAAAAPIPGAGERLQSVAGSGGKRPPTRGWAGRQGRRATGRSGGAAGPARTPALAGPPVGAPLQESPAPGEACRLRRRSGPHLRHGPLQRSPRPPQSPVRERHEIPNSWRAAAPGYPPHPPVVGDAPSRAPERRGNARDRQES